MKTNLKPLSIDDLIALRDEISREIESRRKEARKKLWQEFQDKAKALGVSLEELLAGQKKTRAKARSGKIAVKYVHPADKTLTWTGRGKQPLWVAEWLRAGKSLDDLKV